MSSDSDSDSSTKKKKRRRQRKKKNDSDDSDEDVDSDDTDQQQDSDASSDEGKGPSKDERAGNTAKKLAMSYEKEYNQLRHVIHHLKHYLIVDRNIALPTIHLLKEQSGKLLLQAAQKSSPKQSEWVQWLHAWKEEHLDRAQSRYQLLLQLKADIRCFSRGLSSSSSSSAKTVELPKEWLEAMLYGTSYELLIKEKKDKLDREHFRKQRIKKMKAMENAEWEESCKEAASMVQRVWRSRSAYRKIQAMLDDVWEKVYDPNKEGYYYYNRKTDTATWEKPKLLHHEIEGTY